MLSSFRSVPPSPPPPPLPRSRDRPPPLKSCLPDVDEDLEALPSDEPFVRKTVHFPDDKDLVQVRTIPPRPPRWTADSKFMKATVHDNSRKDFIMYSPRQSSTNNRFLIKRPDGRARPRFETRSAWSSVQRSYRLGAAYATEPRSPRFEPSSDGSQATPAADCSFDATSFRGQPPATAECGPQPETILRGHAQPLDMSTLTSALPDSDTFDMSSLLHALPEPEVTGTAFDMTSLVEALPDLDGSHGASPLTPVPKSLDVPSTPESPEVGYPRVVVQTHVQVGPMSGTWFSRLCCTLFVLAIIFPRLVPALLAVLAFLFLYEACT
jgi:hypothetical protein